MADLAVGQFQENSLGFAILAGSARHAHCLLEIHGENRFRRAGGGSERHYQDQEY